MDIPVRVFLVWSMNARWSDGAETVPRSKVGNSAAWTHRLARMRTIMDSAMLMGGRVRGKAYGE